MSVSTMRLPSEMVFIWKAIKSYKKGHMINRIVHSWSFHMKFMKLAEGSFHKFHIKCHLCKVLNFLKAIVSGKNVIHDISLLLHHDLKLKISAIPLHGGVMKV